MRLLHFHMFVESRIHGVLKADTELFLEPVSYDIIMKRNVSFTVV
jgi:hypothetical protein